MPLDGLSNSQVGINRLITPIESAMHAEHLAKSQAETSIKKVDKGEEAKNDIKDKEDEKEHQGKYEGRDTEDSESDEQNEEYQGGKLVLSKKNIQKFKVKFNNLTDMVELTDQKTGLVVETVSPSDLMNIISKSKSASGVLVDRQI